MIRPTGILPPLLFLLLLPPGFCAAADVTNLRTEFTTSRLTITYDLTGTAAEKAAAVEFGVVIRGRPYPSRTLTVSGDFGSSIPTGPGRRIIWQHALDFPEGLDSTIKCSINAVSADALTDENTSPAEGFRDTFYAVNRQTVTESRTRLMWARNANTAVRPMKYVDALQFIERLNRERFAGYNDWRIPTRDDFEALMFFGKKSGWGTGLGHFISDYLTQRGFTNTQPASYWTATPDNAAPGLQLVGNTWKGNIRPLEPANYYQVWPVRNARQ